MMPNELQSAELLRLDSHFGRVQRHLHSATPRRLSPVQRRARATHLERLKAYARRRTFPKNLRFPGQMLPHFIDELGTRCAMGYLIEASGARDVVQYIARERNFERIRELRNIPELVAWLEANGLSAEEAAMIQPSYCGTPANNCLCQDAVYSGMVEGTIGDGGASLIVTAAYGPSTAKPGDEVPLVFGSVTPAPTDIVFARWNPAGSSAQFVATGGTVTIPTSACTFGQVAEIPGPLPVDVVRAALSATTGGSTAAACEQVLVDYDAKWGEMQGGSECTGQGGSGGTSSGGGTGGTISNTGGAAASKADAGPRDGGAQATSDAGGGCGIAHSAAFGAETLLALGAALAIYRVRRL